MMEVDASASEDEDKLLKRFNSFLDKAEASVVPKQSGDIQALLTGLAGSGQQQQQALAVLNTLFSAFVQSQNPGGLQGFSPNGQQWGFPQGLSPNTAGASGIGTLAPQPTNLMNKLLRTFLVIQLKYLSNLTYHV